MKQFTAKDPPSCRTCGACCVGEGSSGDGFADVLPDDERAMNKRVRRLHLIQQPWCSNAMTRLEQHAQTAGPLTGLKLSGCSALSGSVFKRVECTIYGERPTVCRRFERGSRECREARRHLVDEVSRFLDEESEAA